MIQIMSKLIVASLAVAGIHLPSTPEVNQQDELPRKPTFGARLLADENGVKLGSIIEGTSAQASNLQVDDIVISINGEKTGDIQQFLSVWGQANSNKSYPLVIKRGDKTLNLQLKTVERARDNGNNHFSVQYNHVVSNGHRIRTIITKPKKEGKYPVFFLMQGLGQFSMDYPVEGNGPYSQFYQHYANKDFVTLRVEKPGMGDSEGGPYPETDFYTEADVYSQAIKAIKKYDFIDPNQIYVFGHSMGGVMGPAVLKDEPVAGFIAGSTVFKTWTEYWLENVRRQNILAGSSEVQVDQDLRSLATINALVLGEGKDPLEVAKMLPEHKDEIMATFPEGKTMQGRTIKFWQQLAAINYAENWSKVDVPTLTIWGQYDFISTEEDHKMIVKFLNKRKPGLASYKRIDNADHSFNVRTSYEDAFAKLRQAGPFNNQVITTIDNWINEQRANTETQLP